MSTGKGKGPSQREQAIRAVTDQLLTEKFTQDLGQKARVDRSSISSEHMDKLREVLSDIGQNMQEVGAVPKGMTYRGSLSIHVFTADSIKEAAFATLTNLGTMDATLADGALRELTGSTMIQYGKHRQKLRSGF